MLQQKYDIIRQLQSEILPLQGYKPSLSKVPIGLSDIEAAFPNGVFPTAAMHECITATPENAAATACFITGILSNLIKNSGACIWISSTATIFPPALAMFGIDPHHVIFIQPKAKDALWVMEECLKCEGISAVIGEINNLDFKSSRRLQLAVEQSRVTGFVIRHNLRQVNTIACVARWKITPLQSEQEDNMPGVGFLRWHVELQKVRNGKPASWQVEWSADRFHIIHPEKQAIWLHGLSHYGSAI